LIGGKLVIFRTPRGTFADKKMKRKLDRKYRKAYEEGKALFS